MNDVTVRLRFYAGSPLKMRKKIIEVLEGLGFNRVGNSLIWKMKMDRGEVAVSLNSFFKGDEQDG